ncbi:histidine kinase N-terminal 7TM domain-containing protein [Methanobacterium oryzae]|uniref:histidine kinase N-terminal 7TM domain-containing protein n=1 Tax=Methanobacterium oryzae TaxID=69540 RepID=UPI003D1DD1C7
MNEQYLIYAAGFAITFLVSFILVVYGFKKRSIQLHTFFILALLSICVWSFGSLMEFISPDITSKILWAKFSWIGITTVSPFLFLFVLSYGKHEKLLKKPYIVLLLVMPSLITILAFTNELHHLIWANIIPVSTNLGVILVYKHGLAVWLNLLYSYPLLIIGMVLMVYMFINSSKVYKLQVAAVLIGIATPLILNIIYLGRISPVLVDLTPIAFGITSIFAAIGVFRFDLLNILPVAHSKLFKNMTNGFLVFDNDDRLLEINSKGQEIFKITSDSIGSKFNDIFGKYEKLTSFYRESENNAELLINNKWFNLQKTPLYDKENISYGHLIIITDIDKHKKSEADLKENQRMLKTLISNLPGVAYKCKNDPQWTMEFVSEGCLELTGYPVRDLLMNKKIAYNDLVHEDDREYVWSEIQNALEEKRPFKLIYRINTADLKEKFVWEQGRGVFSEYGELLSLEGFITDITDSKESEEKLKNSLKEKNILLQEIHHRVKNNMQIISSLLNLQSRYVSEEGTLNVLKESQSRIKAMGMVHEKLYQSDNLARINFADYIKSLINELYSSNYINSELIKLNIDTEDLYLDINTAIPCGLIINELITNVIKHAFPDLVNNPERLSKNNHGNIYIKFSKNKNKYNLIVSDDGIGLSLDTDFKNTNTLGLQLVNALVDQLDGTMKINRANGTEFIINFYEQPKNSMNFDP